MPRPTRRNPQQQQSTKEKENTASGTLASEHRTQLRTLRSHTRRSLQPSATPEKTPSPGKPSATLGDPSSAATGGVPMDFALVYHTPKPLSPRYGRRISYGSPAGRRISLGSSSGGGAVFDGLIDGFSPIKAGPPPPEEGDLGALVSVDLEKEYSRFSAVGSKRRRGYLADKEVDQDGMEKMGEVDEADSDEKDSGGEDDDDDDSDEFDIDRIVAARRTRRDASGQKAASANASAAAAAAAAANRTSGSSSGLPKRNRTLKPVIAKKSKKKASSSSSSSSSASAAGPSRNKAGKSAASERSRRSAAAQKQLCDFDAKGFDDIDDFELVEETV